MTGFARVNVIPIIRCQHWDDAVAGVGQCARPPEPGHAYCARHLYGDTDWTTHDRTPAPGTRCVDCHTVIPADTGLQAGTNAYCATHAAAYLERLDRRHRPERYDHGHVTPVVGCQHWDDAADPTTRCTANARPGFAYCADHLDTDQPYYDTTGDTPDAELVDPSLHPVDLRPVLDGTAQRPEPTILRRDDRQALFYPGQVNGLHGDSGTGKGWVALVAIAQQLRAGRHVIMVDLEDVPESIVARLRQLGVTDDEMTDRLIYIRPTVELGPLAVAWLLQIITERDVSLVVIDSLGEAFGLAAIDENHDAEVGPWLRAVARVLADAGPAVILIDHSTKANDNPLHPSGSKRKRAAIGGASYYVTAPKPLSAEHGGRLRLTCAKDRHGTFARGETVADIVMQIGPGTCRVDVYAPSEPDSAGDVLARRILEVVAAEAGCSLRGLRAALEQAKVKASHQRINDTVALLVDRGELVETAGPRGARELSVPPGLGTP